MFILKSTLNYMSDMLKYASLHNIYYRYHSYRYITIILFKINFMYCIILKLNFELNKQ